MSDDVSHNQTGDTIHGDNIGGDKVAGDKIAGNKISVHLPTPEQRRHQLRAPVGDFVGREREIDRLTGALTGGSGAAICGLRGMGGIGKTELALVVANQLAAQFSDGQIVVELFGASNPITPEAALQTVIRAFAPEAKLPDDLPALTQWYRASLNGKRVLVLADDAHDAAQVRPLLPPTGCALLVTSRYTIDLDTLDSMNLDTLAKEEAISLLHKEAPRIGEHAARIAELCGYLPLALRICARLLRKPLRDVAAFVEQLADERQRLGLLKLPNDTNRDVEAALTLSYAALATDTQQAFAQLGVFLGDFAPDAARSVLDVESTRPLDTLLEELYDASLLDVDETTARYDLHDLVRAFALARLEEWRMENAELRMTAPPFSTLHSQFSIETRLRHARYYQQIAYHADKELYKKGQVLEGLALFDRERRQIDAGWGWAMEAAGRRGGEEAIDTLLLDFANATVYVGDLRYDLRREQIPHLEAQRDAARRLGRRGAEGAALGNLGLAYADLGEYPRAIDYHEQALVISREIGDRRGEGNALGNLGLAYRNLGEYPRAIDYHEQALVISREIGDRRGEGNALGNLGIAYYSLGDYPHAIEYHEQHLAIAREIGDRRGEGNALGNLGIAYNDLGDYPRAIETLEQRLVIAREIGDRRGEGNAQGNLGSAYNALGDYPRAIDYHEQYLAIAREIGDRRGEGNALGNLGIAYTDLGEEQRAIAYYEQGLVIDREIGDIQGEAIDSWNLGLLYEQQGDLARAEPLIAHAAAFMAQIGHATRAKKYADGLERVRAKLREGGG
jgi:tetratricopeptide (TPR) repeat protein